ncbi:HAMP domain-containing protein [Bradyrhizobium sp. GM24.11]
MKIRLSLSSAIIAFGIVLVIGFTAVVSTSLYALRELKVGGPLYSDIKLGNDLIADILPPPEYVIEAYLEATLAMREPEQLAAHGERLVQLRKDYDERKAFWVSSSLSADLKAALVSKSDAEVQKFWKILTDQLLPALKSKDMAGAERAYAQVKDAYTAHRAVIDSIVENANKQNADMEKLAADRDSSILYILLGVAAAVLAFIAAGLLGVVLGVVRPIVRMTDTMQTLATGDLAVDIPFAYRQDEVGSMAGALQVFKQGAIENSRLREEQLQKEQEAALAKRGALHQMAETVERETGRSVDTASATTQGVERAASSLSEIARSLSSESQAVAAASTQALGSSQTVSAAAEELSASIREIATQVARTSTVTKSAVAGRERGAFDHPGAGGRGEEDRRGFRPHRRHRRPDQSARAQRHDRGRARRRCRPRVCGGRRRSEIPVRPDRQIHRGDHAADRRGPGLDPGCGRCRRDHGGPHRRDRRCCDLGCRCDGRAGCRDAGDRPVDLRIGLRREGSLGQDRQCQP